MRDRTFRYELVSLDNCLWDRIRLFFTGRHTLTRHGRYFTEAKARQHLDQLRSSKPYGIYIYDVTIGDII